LGICHISKESFVYATHLVNLTRCCTCCSDMNTCSVATTWIKRRSMEQTSSLVPISSVIRPERVIGLGDTDVAHEEMIRDLCLKEPFDAKLVGLQDRGSSHNQKRCRPSEAPLQAGGLGLGLLTKRSAGAWVESTVYMSIALIPKSLFLAQRPSEWC
jgi:hypothetical protein